jgi:hypothetical protein
MRAYLSALRTDSDSALDESDRQFLALLRADRIDGLGELLLAAFTVAARRRFAPTWSHAEIIRFVADVRGRSDEMAAMLRPAVAENQLSLALGEKLAPYPDMQARGRTQMLLLGVLTSQYSPQEPDTLLTDACALACEAIASGQQGGGRG